MKPAVVYDGGWRDNGTPFYVRGALARVLGEDPDWYTEAAEIQQGHPLYLHVDDGRDDLSVEGIPRPWGYWAIDSHLGPEIRIKKALEADIVWCAQKPFVEVLHQHGVDARWLPLACEPTIHTSDVGNPIHDLVFVGHLQDPQLTNRIEFLDRLFKTVRRPYFRYGVFHEEMAKCYAHGKIGVNHAVRDDLNMRFFELASIRVPQLADERMVGLTDLGFEPWKHFLPYHDIESAIRVVEDELEGSHREMVVSAYELAVSKHTYTHRVQQMLADAKDRGFL